MQKKKALVLSWSSLLNADKCLSTQIYLTQSVHDSLTWLSHVVSTMRQKEPRPLLGYTSKTASTPPLPLCGPLTWPLCFERWAPFFFSIFLLLPQHTCQRILPQLFKVTHPPYAPFRLAIKHSLCQTHTSHLSCKQSGGQTLSQPGMSHFCSPFPPNTHTPLHPVTLQCSGDAPTRSRQTWFRNLKNMPLCFCSNNPTTDAPSQ